MKDRQIRMLLQRTELASYINDSHSKVVSELKLPVAKARIDIAIFNCHLHGYEIKGASDTLERLPGQLAAYSKVFDYLTIVTEVKYHERILALVPDWVGVTLCSDQKGSESIEVIQPPAFNISKDGFFLAQLLWHSELIEVLKDQSIPHKKNTRCWTLCQILANNVEVSKLAGLVREKIKQRIQWKIKEGYSTM
jgi:hypothetical protein